MFDSYKLESRGFSPPIFVAQLVGAPLGGLILGGLAYVLMAALFRVKDSTWLGYFSFSVEGFLLGYQVQTAIPRAIESGGRWVWIPPLCILAFGVLIELGRGSNSQVGELFVFPSTRGSEGALGMVLITWPLVASCLYSIGIHAASKPPRTFWGKRLRRVFVRENSSNGDNKAARNLAR